MGDDAAATGTTGRTLAFLLAGLLVALDGAAGQLHPPRVFDPVLVSAWDPLPQECQDRATHFARVEYGANLVVHPQHPKRLFATWQQDWGSFPAGNTWSHQGVATARSNDGGLHWKLGYVPTLRSCGGDPAHATRLEVGPDGALYVVLAAAKILVTKSNDWGETWSPAALVGMGGPGREDLWSLPVIATNPTDPDKVYVVWNQDGRLQFSRSDDGGGSWTAATRLPPKTLQEGFVRDPGVSAPEVGSPQVALDGRAIPVGLFLVPGTTAPPREPSLVFLFEDSPSHTDAQAFAMGFAVGANPNPPLFPDADNRHRLFVQRSTNDGKTWDAPVRIATMSSPAAIDPDAKEFLFWDYPSAAMAPDGGLYVTWADSTTAFGAPTQVRLLKSHTAGQTWVGPALVQGVPTTLARLDPSPCTHFGGECEPSMFGTTVAVDRHGVIAVSYYDTRNDNRFHVDAPRDDVLATDVWLSVSRDGGSTWGETHLDGPFDYRRAPLFGMYRRLGDFYGLTPMSDGFGAAYLVSRPHYITDSSDVYFARVLT